MVNVAHWEGEVLFFTPPIALGSLALSFLMTTLTAGAGVFISLRTATAQEATQILPAIILIPPMLLQVIPLLFRDQMMQFLNPPPEVRLLRDTDHASFVGLPIILSQELSHLGE